MDRVPQKSLELCHHRRALPQVRNVSCSWNQLTQSASLLGGFLLYTWVKLNPLQAINARKFTTHPGLKKAVGKRPVSLTDGLETTLRECGFSSCPLEKDTALHVQELIPRYKQTTLSSNTASVFISWATRASAWSSCRWRLSPRVWPSTVVPVGLSAVR